MPSELRRHALVTGGSGFLGRYIVRALAERHPGWHLTILDLLPSDEEVDARPLATFIRADITSPASLEEAFKRASSISKIDVVFHVAGIVPARQDRYSVDAAHWEKVRQVNYEGTTNVVNATLGSGCKRIVYTSSSTTVIDDLDHDYYNVNENVPLDLATLHYGKSKTLAERHVLDGKWRKEQGLLACALRPCAIIGPGDTAVIGVIHDLIAKGETNFIVGDGDNLYDFLCVENAALAHLLAAENLLASEEPTAAGHVFFVSNQEPVYFWDFMAAVWAQFGHVPAYRVHIPVAVAWMVGFILEWITWLTGTASTLDRGSVKDGIRVQYLDNGKAARMLGYKPTVSLSDGVRRSCEEYKFMLARQAKARRNP